MNFEQGFFKRWNKSRRIEKEMRDLGRDHFEIFEFPFNPNQYLFRFDGPQGSPYENIKIGVEFLYPKSYPFEPPVVCFRPPLFHPNVSSEGHFKVLDWTPVIRTKTILQNIIELLHKPFLGSENDKGKEEMEPESDAPYINEEALHLWKNDMEQFKALVDEGAQAPL